MSPHDGWSACAFPARWVEHPDTRRKAANTNVAPAFICDELSLSNVGVQPRRTEDAGSQRDGDPALAGATCSAASLWLRLRRLQKALIAAKTVKRTNTGMTTSRRAVTISSKASDVCSETPEVVAYAQSLLAKSPATNVPPNGSSTRLSTTGRWMLMAFIVCRWCNRHYSDSGTNTTFRPFIAEQRFYRPGFGVWSVERGHRFLI